MNNIEYTYNSNAESEIPKSERPTIIRYKMLIGNRHVKYSSVYMFTPGVLNPEYKSRPIKPS